MATEDEAGPPRPTIALLYELTRAEFGEVKDRLDKLEGLPERVVRLETKVEIFADLPQRTGGLERVAADHEHRLVVVEREREQDAASWRPHWPTLIPAVLAVIVAIVALLT